MTKPLPMAARGEIWLPVKIELRYEITTLNGPRR